MPHNTQLAWLVRRSGPHAGARYLLRGAVTRVGRSPECDIVIDDEEAAVVSGLHLEIRKEGSCYRLHDLDSTNGTYLNGERTLQADVENLAVIRLGPQGPEFALVVEQVGAGRIDQTLVALPATSQPRPTPISTHDEKLLTEAVKRARQARTAGAANQTMLIMRDVVNRAVHRTGRRLKLIIAVLVVALIATSAYGAWRIGQLKREKASIDREIQDLEAALQRENQDPAGRERLIETLNRYEDQARALQRDVFYRIGVREDEEFLRRAIRSLMAEFGAESYSIPPEFLEEVNRFVGQYQTTDRPLMARALGEARKDLETMRRALRDEHLPPDLAFMVLVESAFLSENASRAGAAGLWQFTPATARAYGLKVTKDLDERLNTRKATQAGSQYIRELILEFGSGSSVMLALAAYNFGPGRVKQAVRRVVSDPIKQRDFWYLYRVRALPPETRQYVPKVMAAMIIGRDPERFGF